LLNDRSLSLGIVEREVVDGPYRLMRESIKQCRDQVIRYSGNRSEVVDDPYHLLAHACIQAPSCSPRTCSRIWPDLALSNLTSGWMPSALVTMCWLDRSIDSERLHSAYLMREAIRAHQRLIKA